MSKVRIGFTDVKNPYDFLAINILNEAFWDIECYFSKEGTEEEIEEGKKSLRWIRRMEGNFEQISSASNMSLEQFHQVCIWKINQIKAKVRKKKKEKYEKSRLGNKNI